MMKKIKWLVIILGLFLVAYFGYNYIFQGHRDIKKEKAQFSIASNILIEEFKKNAHLAQTKYLNTTLEITGNISEISQTHITLDNYIFNSFNSNFNPKSFKINNTVTIKGRCIGYDDLLEQIKLDQCTIKSAPKK